MRSVGLAAPVWGAIYLGVAAATLPAVLPVMVGVLADDLGFGTVRAGYVASANLGGVAVGSALCAALVRRSTWSALITGGAIAMIATNLATMLVASFPLFAMLRFTSGAGEGVIQAICYAAMSRCSQPHRALAFYIAGQGLAGALGMGFIPGIVAKAGWPWLFVVVSVVVVPAFWLARRIDTLRGSQSGGTQAGAEGTMDAAGTMGAASAASWWSRVALACIFVYFIGMAAVWSFTERVGHAKGIDADHLTIALSSSAIANMAGSLLVGFLAHRLSTLAGLGLGLTLALGGLTILASADHWFAYLAAVSLFFFSWGIYYPFQFSMLANADRSGGMAVLIPLATGAAFTVGPALGGHLLSAGGATLLCAFGAVCILASAAVSTRLHFKFSPSGVAP
jgi:predicted MFS family arabinose efflux permease